MLKIWNYITKRIEDDNVFPSEDDVYTRFQHSFEIDGVKWEVAEQEVRNYARCTGLDGVKIEWEGELV